MVVAAGGGAAGVIVLVMTWPVTVMIDVQGVADQLLLDGEGVLDDEGVLDVVLVVVKIRGGVGVGVVDGVLAVIDTGINVGVEVVLVVVDVVEGVCSQLVSRYSLTFDRAVAW